MLSQQVKKVERILTPVVFIDNQILVTGIIYMLYLMTKVI